MLPNYAGRLLDKFILIVAKQTSNVKENPDDTNYPDKRASVVKSTAMALYRVRNEMQRDRRDEEERQRKATEPEKA